MAEIGRRLRARRNRIFDGKAAVSQTLDLGENEPHKVA